MTLKEFIQNPPDPIYGWIAKQFSRVKITDAYLNSEVSYTQSVQRDMKARGQVEMVTVGDFNISTGGGKGKINGEILQWGEAYKRMRDILSGKEICAPIRSTTETQDTLPLELRTTWVNRALMEKNNAECEKRAVDYWNKRCPGTY